MQEPHFGEWGALPEAGHFAEEVWQVKLLFLCATVPAVTSVGGISGTPLATISSTSSSLGRGDFTSRDLFQDRGRHTHGPMGRLRSEQLNV
jgi:hypothetical protein